MLLLRGTCLMSCLIYVRTNRASTLVPAPLTLCQNSDIYGISPTSTLVRLCHFLTLRYQSTAFVPDTLVTSDNKQTHQRKKNGGAPSTTTKKSGKNTPERRIRGEGAPRREGGGKPVPRAEETTRTPRSRRLPHGAFSPALVGGGGGGSSLLGYRLPFRPLRMPASTEAHLGRGGIPCGGRANDLLSIMRC